MPRRSPLRTVRATRRGIRLKQAARARGLVLCRLLTLGQSPSRVALKIRCRSRRTSRSQENQWTHTGGRDPPGRWRIHRPAARLPRPRPRIGTVTAARIGPCPANMNCGTLWRRRFAGKADASIRLGHGNTVADRHCSHTGRSPRVRSLSSASTSSCPARGWPRESSGRRPGVSFSGSSPVRSCRGCAHSAAPPRSTGCPVPPSGSTAHRWTLRRAPRHGRRPEPREPSR